MQTAAPPLVIHTIDHAPWYVLLHLGLALAALAVGVAVLARRKGDSIHKLLGRSWVLLMITAALTSFFIQARGRLSLIHIFSVVVLITVPLGVAHIRRRNVRRHRVTMLSIFAGLVITGAFTLLPYRMLGQLMFGPN